MAQIIGTRELSEITGLSEGQIRSLARSGLPAHRVGACLAFDAQEALTWLEHSGLLDSEDGEEEVDDHDEQDDDDAEEDGEDGDENDDAA